MNRRHKVKPQAGNINGLDPSADAAAKALRALENPPKAQFLAGFFKTGKGQYAEGDRFLGITVPQVRAIARQIREMPVAQCEILLQSPYNEERLLALIILTRRHERGGQAERMAIYELYWRNRHQVNNWNLVDISAPQIVGETLATSNRAPLYDLARSQSLWDRRIAIVATLAFIRKNDFADTLTISEMLLRDPEDLLHKACGWMLREAGKRDETVLNGFLQQHCRVMPRTMLRYAIEKYSPDHRRAWLDGHPPAGLDKEKWATRGAQ
jgi:3-methyladenine DNA glycosylase AlkD